MMRILMKLMRRRSIAALLTIGAFTFAESAGALTVGQIDDFQDGTTQNWANGGAPGVPPVLNVNGGGPAGANDNFMQINSMGGVGPGKVLTVFNRNQWTGDYITAGVTAIELDLQNQGDVDLNIRLVFKQVAGSQTGYLSTALFLPAGSDWTHAVFLVNSASLTAVGGPDSFSPFFADIEDVRIINEAGTSNLSGDVVVAQLGIDNIRAVPEPGVIALTSVGLLIFGATCRRKKNLV